jgi:RNA-directed DNA polymerase
LVVNEKVNVDRKMLKKTRAMLHDLRFNGSTKAAQNHFKTTHTPKPLERLKFLQKLKGTINFIGQVRGKEDPTFLKMQQDFARCFVRYKEELNAQ